MKYTNLPIILALSLLAVLAHGCASKKDPGFVGKVYHDITARNNAYFNATEIYRSVQNNIRESRQEDFKAILPVYTDRDPDMAASYSADLDEVIKKASLGIQVHEPSKYTDNNYLLIGKTYFMKGEYNTALETFQYTNTEFKDKKKKDSKKKKKKKKKKKSSKSKKRKKPMTASQLEELKKEELKEKREEKDEELAEGKKDPLHWLKHQPVRPDAMIWLVDTYTAMEKYREAEQVLTLIDADEEFPAWLKRDLEIARANYFLQKGDLEKAIEPLTYLTENIKMKRKKMRYYYILGQINERIGDKVAAIDNYKKVLKGRPPYDFSFNAKMSIAKISSRDNAIPSDDVIKLLTKMLRERKNREFYDQIYYALAELSLASGKREEAMDYLKKSIASSQGNNDQKALSYLKVGELYFADEEYEKAQPYYDSTLTLITADFNGFAEINARKGILSSLVAQINTIAVQDSLIELYSMTEEEKLAFVQKKLDEQREAEEEKQRQLENPIFAENDKGSSNNNNSGGTWYFYNTSAKSLGYNEFVKKWGTRKLEDNWRRSDRSTILADNDNEGTDGEEVAPKNEDELIQEMLKELEGGDDKLTASNQQIVDAYFRLANIYRFDLQNYKKAIETYEELLKRYPGNKHEAETLYNLYLLHDKQGNITKAEFYKNEVLANYPNSNMAMIIRNPNYLEASNQIKNEITNYYMATFDAYSQNRLEEALQRIQYADSIYAGKNHLQAKFDLLEAFVIGKTSDLKSYKEALGEIITNYPGDPVKTKAEEILSYIEDSEDSTIVLQNNILRYEFDKQSRHFVMLAYKDVKGLKLSDLTNKVAQYNDKQHALLTLTIDPLILPDGYNMLLIKSFDDLAKAQAYYDALKAEAPALFEENNTKIGYYMISDVNFNKIIINKEIGTYIDFFNAKYLK